MWYTNYVELEMYKVKVTGTLILSVFVQPEEGCLDGGQNFVFTCSRQLKADNQIAFEVMHVYCCL